MHIAITDFALRNWEPGASGTRVEGLSPEALVARCNAAVAGGQGLVPGYAPFCTHLFLPNETPTRCGFAPVTPTNEGRLRSGYRARREGERAVLERWFEDVEAPVANWLDVILYSREQLVAEAADYPDGGAVPACDWGIVSIIGTLEPREPPMPPITQMRNALGRAEGGSGRPIDAAKYDEAVAFWERHASVRQP
ncbi:MAG TPA: DUF3228 family protein [Paracoccaceae bacterium]|nr:DUF3228 family protein [Paracoccaceae bacterium]